MGNNFTDYTDRIDRVDAKEKVTGTAKYAAEYHFANLAYGVVVGSTITRGTITSIDIKSAERAPGVLAVITHLNIPKMSAYQITEEDSKVPDSKKGYKVFQNNE